MNAQAHIKALDLFAGTGWGVACQRLGIKEAGVEIMPEAVATRTANGMETIYNDVWDGLKLTAEQHRDQYGSYGLLIASPPCQTFSLAGKGAGRAALDEVLEAIELHAYKDADALLQFGQAHDMRTALVLSPLAYVWRDRPRLVAMEQVPTVLPVWEACAEVMREWGYDVKVEVLNAEQYGVPQARKRAILVARRNGEVHLPTPTHSRYYSRTPEKLDAGVLKWVSMAEALGWNQSPTSLRSNYGTGGDSSKRGERTTNQPAPTLTSKADRNKWDGEQNMSVDEAAALQSYPAGIYVHPMTNGRRGIWPANEPAPTIRGVNRPMPATYENHERDACTPEEAHPRLTVEESGILQTYERPFIWCGTKGKQFLQIGNAVPPLLAEHILATLIGLKAGR